MIPSEYLVQARTTMKLLVSCMSRARTKGKKINRRKAYEVEAMQLNV